MDQSFFIMFDRADRCANTILDVTDDRVCEGRRGTSPAALITLCPCPCRSLAAYSVPSCCRSTAWHVVLPVTVHQLNPIITVRVVHSTHPPNVNAPVAGLAAGVLQRIPITQGKQSPTGRSSCASWYRCGYVTPNTTPATKSMPASTPPFTAPIQANSQLVHTPTQ